MNKFQVQNQSLRQSVLLALENTQSATFCNLLYRNENNELSRYTLNLNTSFMNMYQDDLKTLETMQVSTELEKTAKDELLKSVKKSIDTEFQHEKNPTKNMTTLQKSLKFHAEKDEMYIHAVVVSKKVIEKGEYKVVNSKELTIVKNQLKKQLKQSKIRFFKINLNQIKNISANKNRIVIVAN